MTDEQTQELREQIAKEIRLDDGNLFVSEGQRADNILHLILSAVEGIEKKNPYRNVTLSTGTFHLSESVTFPLRDRYDIALNEVLKELIAKVCTAQLEAVKKLMGGE
jgi:hypothetical protein